LKITGGVYISKKIVRNELEEKIKEKSKFCPYCDSELKFGYLKSVLPIFWGEELDRFHGLKTNVIQMTGIDAPVNELPSLHCTCCGVVVSQYR